MKFFSIPSHTLVLGLALSLAPVTADTIALAEDRKPLVDEVDIEAMRRELARIRQASKSSTKPGASTEKLAADAPALGEEPTTGKGDTKSDRDAMLAKEAELLNMLTASKGDSANVLQATSEGSSVSTNVVNTSSNKSAPVAAPSAKAADAPENVTAEAVKPQTNAQKHTTPNSSSEAILVTSNTAGTPGSEASERARLSQPAVTTTEKGVASKESERVRSLENSLVSLRKENSTLEQQLSKSKIKQSELANELDEVRNRLMVAERQVELMSARLANRNLETRRSALNGATQSGASSLAAAAPRLNPHTQAPAPIVAQRRIPLTQPVDNRPATDMLVGRVVAEKANLRSAPGLNNSPMMTVPRGTTLVVETRQGDWYRVYAPNGTRAWVASEVLEFTPSTQTASSSVGGDSKPYVGF
jgi:hypothetical protein